MSEKIETPDDAYADWWRRKCKHPESRLVRSSNSDKSIAVRMECLHCGALFGNAAARPVGWESLPVHDPAKHAAYEAQRDAELDQIVAGHKAEKADATAKWRADYSEYLQTDKWKKVRNAVMRRENYICQGCGAEEATEVHHISYFAYNYGHELLFNLAALCRDCHELCHADKYPHKFKLRNEL